MPVPATTAITAKFTLRCRHQLSLGSSRLAHAPGTLQLMMNSVEDKKMRRETSRIIGTVALLLATMVPTARAQIYGPWSAPVNVNNMVSDGTVCSAVVNSTSPDVNDTHPAISKDGLSLYFAST